MQDELKLFSRIPVFTRCAIPHVLRSVMSSTHGAMRGEDTVDLRPERSAARVGIEAAIRLQAIRPAGIHVRHRCGRLPGLGELAYGAVHKHHEICAAGGKALYELPSPFDSTTDKVADQHQQATYHNAYERRHRVHDSIMSKLSRSQVITGRAFTEGHGKLPQGDEHLPAPAVGLQIHRLDHRVLDPEHPPPYPRCAHAVPVMIVPSCGSSGTLDRGVRPQTIMNWHPQERQ